MVQSKILVDTNAYIRMAKSIRPLLFCEFGADQYCLYIIPELNQELQNKRLTHKFPWVEDAEYADNRKNFPALSRKQKASIKDTFEFIWSYVKENLIGTSRVDALYIAYAIELDIPVVTDDQEMSGVAKVFDCKVMPTLQVLKIMFDAGHVDMKVIDGLVNYWRYIQDEPANLVKDYKRFFGKKLPAS